MLFPPCKFFIILLGNEFLPKLKISCLFPETSTDAPVESKEMYSGYFKTLSACGLKSIGSAIHLLTGLLL